VTGNCKETGDTSSFEIGVFSAQILCEFCLFRATSLSVEERLVRRVKK
jgi:hypothetical protein